MADTLKSSSPLTWLVDAVRPTKERVDPLFRYAGDARSWLIPAGMGVALLAVSVVGLFVGEAERFFFAYLVGWTFCVSLALGALFFILIHHLTKAHWGIVLRRIPEALIWSFPVLALLGLPLLFGMHDLFHWTHEGIADPSSPHYDEVIAGKTAYLNTPFFLTRMAVYFVAWTVIAYKLYRLSLQQDVDPRPDNPARLRKVSAWATPVYAVTLAFFSFDALMSLDPHWFSTIFGVYYFAGSFFGATALITLVAILLQRRGGMLTSTISKEHYHDLGKWMFAFTAFWAYIAYSQYMLIWYGGLPEETVWFRHRMEHGWEVHSYVLALFHFVLPFIILLPRAPKRSIPMLSVMGGWFLVIHWFDLHWLAMPVASPHHAGIHWLDVSCGLGLFLLMTGLFFYRFSRHSIVPVNDPYLAKSLHFHNI